MLLHTNGHPCWGLVGHPKLWKFIETVYPNTRELEIMQLRKNARIHTAPKEYQTSSVLASQETKLYELEPSVEASPYTIKYAGRIASLEYTHDSS